MALVDMFLSFSYYVLGLADLGSSFHALYCLLGWGSKLAAELVLEGLPKPPLEIQATYNWPHKCDSKPLKRPQSRLGQDKFALPV